MSGEALSAKLIEKSLNYHGMPLLKIWEGERGESDLTKLGIQNLDFAVYQMRQKNLTFQDRAKRLKLHQFISKNATQLFSESLIDNHSVTIIEDDEWGKDTSVQIPLLEALLPADKTGRTRHFFDNVQRGDVIFGTVMNKSTPGYIIKVACSAGSQDRYVQDLAIKAYVPYSNTTSSGDKKTANRSLVQGNFVCCEVQEVTAETEKLVCEMKGSVCRIGDKEYTTGLVTSEQFPDFYKITSEKKNFTFEEILQSSPSFKNPYSDEYLFESVGLSPREHYSIMSSLRGRFPQQEYSNELRQVQASKWAFRSVAEGIEHFKVGRHSEAFQCLNKALNIDPRNVEGLVARGALYANSGSFKKAVDDFETALKLNPSHANARKYMGETLVALGRSYEEENKLEEARKAYQDCLVIIPHHEEAMNSLEYLKNRSQKQPSMLFEPGELELPALNFNTKERKLDDVLGGGSSKKDKKSKKKKPKGKSSKKYSSSSGSSSDSSDSSDSDSDSSSDTDSSSSSGSDESHGGRKKKGSKKKREKSMSPLSKRMAIMSGNVRDSSESASYQFNQSYMSTDSVPQAPPPPSVVDDYELKVRQFLEITRDEDNYEEKVRKFVEEASKYRKERKLMEEKNRKKKKKDGKKSKKESRKRRKEKEEKHRKKSTKKDKIELDDLENKKLREALKIFEKLPVLDELGSKLSSIYGKSTDNDGKIDEDSKGKGKRQSPEKDDYPEGKWKMIFTKDQKKDAKPSTSKGGSSLAKQHPFMGDSEDSDTEDNLGQPQPSTSSSSYYDKRRGDDEKKRRSSPHGGQKKYDVPKSAAKSTPVVLDKFGSFRLATADRTPPKAPMQFQRRSRSRSKSKKRSSSSQSRSRTPQRRRSRSLSYTKRRYSRSRSRSYRSRTRSRSKSYSRSRSRSRSMDRHRFEKRSFRGHGYDRDRGTGFYKSRFNPRGGYRGRGGGFRDNRDFRGRGRDRPFRARGRGNPRYMSSRGRDDHRDRRYDRDGSYDRNSDRESNYDDRRDRFSKRSSKEHRRSITPTKAMDKGKGEMDDVTTSAATAEN
ncbi:tetratricopeptide repeat protein 14 homolog [Lutzomyia longipalpis]|uniref:Putative tpr repeat-containing protein n=1 Tax=Lutzomyia longipalpis TaxID=7200 RepID=A0A7G3AZP3_LUTLO|nr:tetratricopeptide repeat protein 14 homolog [Lutzomyia longipalpis]